MYMYMYMYILYYIILYYVMLYYIISHYFILYYIILYYIILYYHIYIYYYIKNILYYIIYFFQFISIPHSFTARPSGAPTPSALTRPRNPRACRAGCRRMARTMRTCPRRCRSRPMVWGSSRCFPEKNIGLIVDFPIKNCDFPLL